MLSVDRQLKPSSGFRIRAFITKNGGESPDGFRLTGQGRNAGDLYGAAGKEFPLRHDFRGKTVIPFATHGGGGMTRDIRKARSEAAFGKGGAFFGGRMRKTFCAGGAARSWMSTEKSAREGALWWRRRIRPFFICQEMGEPLGATMRRLPGHFPWMEWPCGGPTWPGGSDKIRVPGKQTCRKNSVGRVFRASGRRTEKVFPASAMSDNRRLRDFLPVVHFSCHTDGKRL